MKKPTTVAAPKAGRPLTYKVEFVKQAAHACRFGATRDDLATILGVSPRCIDNWMVKYPDFRAAVHSAKAEADQNVQRSLYDRAMGYEHQAVKIFLHEGKPVEVPYTEKYAPDTVACIFWLKNRDPKNWRDKAVVEHEGLEDLAASLQAARARANAR